MNFKNSFVAIACATAILSSCKKDDVKGPVDIIKQDFQLAFASGTESNSATYLQGRKDLTEGEINFEGEGYQLPSSRTARIFVAEDGSAIYSLNYTVGTVDKFYYNGGDNYTHVDQIDASIPLGVKALRFTKLNEEYASLHNMAAVVAYDESGNNYIGHKMTLSIGILDLAKMELRPEFKNGIDFKLPGNYGQEGYFISRIDAPVLSNGKLYYGASVSKFNEVTGKNDPTDKTFTLVVDFPSLENATIIETSIVKGSTNGYRTPTQHVDETGDILQMVSTTDGNNLAILKIRNGSYTSYNFDIDQALGRKASSNGWFYVGNGIGYMPYQKVGDATFQIGVDASGNPTTSAPWGLLRIDLRNQTVVDLKTPEKLWLQQYQTSVARDGKFYIALAPVGEQGYIYIYDINSTDPEGTKGAKIKAGADQYYIGIY